MDILQSINGVPIRLTDERWVHIVENHDDLAGFHDEIVDILEYPEYIIVSFKRPQRATDSEMLENGVLLRYRGTELVGHNNNGCLKKMRLMSKNESGIKP